MFSHIKDFFLYLSLFRKSGVSTHKHNLANNTVAWVGGVNSTMGTRIQVKESSQKDGKDIFKAVLRTPLSPHSHPSFLYAPLQLSSQKTILRQKKYWKDICLLTLSQFMPIVHVTQQPNIQLLQDFPSENQVQFCVSERHGIKYEFYN